MNAGSGIEWGGVGGWVDVFWGEVALSRNSVDRPSRLAFKLAPHEAWLLGTCST